MIKIKSNLLLIVINILVQIQWDKYMRTGLHLIATVHMHLSRSACMRTASHVFVPRMYLYREHITITRIV
jgi:hypothetical protein